MPPQRSPKLHPRTQAAQGGGAHDPTSGGVVPALQPSSTYVRDRNYALTQPNTQYSRDDNPTYAHAEKLLADLECGADALLFSSGMAAITALFGTLEAGTHFVVPTKMYFGTTLWLKHLAQQRGLRLSFFDPAQPQTLQCALTPHTRLVWVETPANPVWDVTDIAAAAASAHAVGARLAVDSTAATPVLSRPLELGADLVMHSATKYLNGHSDLTAGALVAKTKDDLWERVRFQRHHGGAVLGAFEAWLLLRGMRTLFVRVAQSSQSALQLARHFERHPRLESVLYPGLKCHPGHAIAKRQMQGGFGGMLSVQVKGGTADALGVAKRLKVFKRATSLGGVESLAEHRKTVEGPDSPTPDNLLRLSVGLEAVEDLIADLAQALGKP